MARRHDTSDYGTATNRSNRLHRPAILANHALHWASSVIVMSIAAYFIDKFSHNTHLIYWICVVGVKNVVSTTITDVV
jgi:hypothetical protein